MRKTVDSKCPEISINETKPGEITNVTNHVNISNLDNTEYLTNDNYTVDDYLN